MAKGKKKSGKSKNRRTGENSIRRIKTEINNCSKKVKKLLKLYTEGRKRWKLDRKGNKVLLDKFQGIISNSKRHQSLLNHIEFLKGKV